MHQKIWYNITREAHSYHSIHTTFTQHITLKYSTFIRIYTKTALIRVGVCNCRMECSTKALAKRNINECNMEDVNKANTMTEPSKTLKEEK